MLKLLLLVLVVAVSAKTKSGGLNPKDFLDLAGSILGSKAGSGSGSAGDAGKNDALGQVAGDLASVAGTSGGVDFIALTKAVIGQWGEMTPEEWKEFFGKFEKHGLEHLWEKLGERCSSNVQCGPEACCLKPTIQGKRAVTDGSNVHYGSYCAKIRKTGETCSDYNSNVHHYNFHCPCGAGLKCKAGGKVVLHPLLTITTNSACVAA